MIYADFESILVSEINEKQNPNESYTNIHIYTNKYQNHVGCSFGYELVSGDDQFSNPSKSYLGQDAAHKFITNMVAESKYCSRVTKTNFNKELAITEEHDESFESSTKCWICENILSLKVMLK